jgi:hypothetical protein
MSSTRQKLPKNAAKVEFILLREEVKSLLNAGFNLRNIHAKLVENHNLAMSYLTLCYYVRKLHEERQGGEYAGQCAPAKPAPLPKLPASPSNSKVTRPEDIDHGKLF